MVDLAEFRQQTRAWLIENCPPAMRTPMREEETVWGGRRAQFASADARIWLERMAEKGWTAPGWPARYGGGDLSRDEERVLREEMAQLRCRPPLRSFGVDMLGPVLLEFGTEEQKQDHLPRIVRGEVRWCQGFSEPQAGSDLASLRTRAERDGDHFVVNGHKIWTSHAHVSDWMFCLVRTDPDARKHLGISFLLIDLDNPGVRAEPIELISGTSTFCETFLTDIRVPAANLVGQINQGWSIAKRLLQHERAGMGSISERHKKSTEDSLVDVAKKYAGATGGKIADAVLRDRIAINEMDAHALRLTTARFESQTAAGTSVGPVSAMLKLTSSEINQQRYDLLMDCLGSSGLGWEGGEFLPQELALTRSWLRSKGNTIEGGSSEVQMNIIAKRVLGLPS